MIIKTTVDRNISRARKRPYPALSLESILSYDWSQIENPPKNTNTSLAMNLLDL